MSTSWLESTLGGDELRMTFAVHLPESTDVHDAASVGGILSAIAHEFSHTCFYFHPAAYRNSYSDETVAYTTERCVRHELAGTPLDEEPPTPEDLAQAAGRMSAAQLYARFGGHYADTIIALFASGVEAKRALAGAARDEPASRSYCTGTPLAGRDFTR